MPLADLFWTMLYLSLFLIWISLLISIFADIFRSEMSGALKAGWVLLVIILPFVGVLIYLIMHGGTMHKRASKAKGPPYLSESVASQTDHTPSLRY